MRRKNNIFQLLILLLLMMGSGEACAQGNRPSLIAGTISKLSSYSEHTSQLSSNTEQSAGQPLGIRYTKKHPLIVVADWSFAPYSFSNGDGNPDGYQADVIRAIFDRLHIAYEIHCMEWTKARQQVREGKAHLMMDIEKTEENLHVGYSKNSFCNYDIGIAYSAESRTVQKITDLLPTDTVCMLQGDYADDYLMHRYIKPVFHVKYIKLSEIYAYLLGGKNRYCIWGYMPLYRLISSHYGAEKILVNQLIDFPAGQFKFFSNDSQLLGELDAMHDRLEKSKVISRLNDKWFDADAGNGTNATHRSIFIALFIILIAVVMLVFFFILLIRKGAVSEELRKEYAAICDMALDLCDTDVIVIDTRRYRVYNVYGNLMPEGEHTMQEYEAMIHPDDLLIENERRRKVDDGVTDNPPINLRMRHHGKGEEYRTMRIYSHVDQAPDGSPIRILLSMTDMTDTIREARELDKAVRDFDQIYERSEIPMAFYSNDGTLQRCNKAALDLFPAGDKMRQYVRRTKLFDFPSFREDIDLNDPEAFHVCFPIKAIDRSIRNYVEYSIRYVHDNSGKPIGYAVVCIIRDRQRQMAQEQKKLSRIIGKKKSELAELRSRMTFVMKRSEMIPFIYSISDGRITFAGDFEHYDLALTEQEYKDTFIFDEPEMTQYSVRSFRECCMEEYHVVRKVRKFCGKEYNQPQWYSINSIPLTDDEGNVTGSFGLAKDITKFVNMQRRLREETEKARDSVRQKSLFIAGMTHELRTPLNAISGFADIMITLGEADSNQRAEYVEIMRQNCRLLIRLIDNIILLAKIDSNGLIPNASPTDFPEAFRKACAMICPAYSLAEGVEYVLDTPDGQLRINVDFPRVIQILEEFVSNAAKYTAKGTVTIGYRYADGIFSVFCRDTGAGIPLEKQSLIFNRFFKIDNYIQGTGLGLSVAKTIATYLNADIEVQSELGKGSTFILSLAAGLSDDLL